MNQLAVEVGFDSDRPTRCHKRVQILFFNENIGWVIFWISSWHQQRLLLPISVSKHAKKGLKKRPMDASSGTLLLLGLLVLHNIIVISKDTLEYSSLRLLAWLWLVIPKMVETEENISQGVREAEKSESLITELGPIEKCNLNWNECLIYKFTSRHISIQILPTIHPYDWNGNCREGRTGRTPRTVLIYFARSELIKTPVFEKPFPIPKLLTHWLVGWLSNFVSSHLEMMPRNCPSKWVHIILMSLYFVVLCLSHNAALSLSLSYVSPYSYYGMCSLSPYLSVRNFTSKVGPIFIIFVPTGLRGGWHSTSWWLGRSNKVFFNVLLRELFLDLDKWHFQGVRLELHRYFLTKRCS